MPLSCSDLEHAGTIAADHDPAPGPDPTGVARLTRRRPARARPSPRSTCRASRDSRPTRPARARPTRPTDRRAASARRAARTAIRPSTTAGGTRPRSTREVDRRTTSTRDAAGTGATRDASPNRRDGPSATGAGATACVRKAIAAGGIGRPITPATAISVSTYGSVWKQRGDRAASTPAAVARARSRSRTAAPRRRRRTAASCRRSAPPGR